MILPYGSSNLVLKSYKFPQGKSNYCSHTYLKKPNHVFTMMNSKDNPWMDLIRNRNKTVEGRVASTAFRSLNENDLVCFHNRSKRILCKVTFVRFYQDFEAMLESEGIENLAPHICKSKKKQDWMKAALHLYHGFPGAKRVKKHGAIAVGLHYIKDYDE